MDEEPDMYPPLDRREEIKQALDTALKKPKANDRQEGGDHYQNKAIQPWDYIISNNIGYLEGNVIKYVSRWKEKHGLQDLKKARHYLDKLIEETDK
jgi:hypothetical protein